MCLRHSRKYEESYAIQPQFGRIYIIKVTVCGCCSGIGGHTVWPLGLKFGMEDHIYPAKVLVAQGFKWSRYLATVMDVQALGAPGTRGLAAAQCPSIQPEVSGYHTGAWHGENLLPSPFSTLIWRSWVQTPWPAKTFLAQNSIACMKGWYPCSRWLSYLTSFTCNLLVLPRTFLPFFLHPLES